MITAEDVKELCLYRLGNRLVQVLKISGSKVVFKYIYREKDRVASLRRFATTVRNINP